MPPVSLASIWTPLLSSSGRSAGSPSGGTVDAKLRYEAGAAVAADAAAALDDADAAGAAAGGHTTGDRNVPVTAWPENRTVATLSACACSRNAEYGTVTVDAADWPNSRYAFQASRPKKTINQIARRSGLGGFAGSGVAPSGPAGGVPPGACREGRLRGDPPEAGPERATPGGPLPSTGSGPFGWLDATTDPPRSGRTAPTIVANPASATRASTAGGAFTGQQGGLRAPLTQAE